MAPWRRPSSSSELAAQASAGVKPGAVQRSPGVIDANGPAWLGAHLLTKREVLAITNVTFPTIWIWMRAGKFPRARVVGGQSMWLSTEIEAWLATLPVRKLKGDAPEAPASEKPAGVELSGSCLRGSAS